MKEAISINRNALVNAPRSMKQGLLFIPDISGYTELVQTLDIETGVEVISELMSAIISSNQLDLQISEIEGDAVLFYKMGTPPAIPAIMEQYHQMTATFQSTWRQIKERLNIQLDLSLKVIVHYGKMSEFRIQGFTKLYGGVVIEAHRLLKNSIPSHSYLLITDEVLQAYPVKFKGDGRCQSYRSNQLCEVYGGLRNICFTYLEPFEEMEVLRPTG